MPEGVGVQDPEEGREIESLQESRRRKPDDKQKGPPEVGVTWNGGKERVSGRVKYNKIQENIRNSLTFK